MKQSRDVAFELLSRVFRGGAYANLLLPSLLRDAKIDGRDAALAQEIGFGTIRMKALLDEIIVKASSRQLSEIDLEVLLILELGCYQLLFTRIPDHAAINESVELAKRNELFRATAFINAILRKVASKDIEQWIKIVTNGLKPLQSLALRSSHPEWIVQALRMALAADSRADEIDNLLLADNQPALVNLVALPGRHENHDLTQLRASKASPIGFVLGTGDPAGLESVQTGKLRIQDAGSQLVALCLEAAKPVRRGEIWLDLCAGPGGKAALLAALAASQGCQLTANEINEQRTQLVRQALAQSGLEAEVITGDGREVKGLYDRILVDAPCSGLGALRRRPEARWRKQSSDIPGLVELQSELVHKAWTIIKPGGVLVYATCSPHPAETTSVVDGLIRSRDFDGSLLNANQILNEIQPTLTMPLGRKTAQLWPHVHETDAMFIAIFEKPIA